MVPLINHKKRKGNQRNKQPKEKHLSISKKPNNDKWIKTQLNNNDNNNDNDKDNDNDNDNDNENDNDNDNENENDNDNDNDNENENDNNNNNNNNKDDQHNEYGYIDKYHGKKKPVELSW